jgi:hypothetical protein
MIDEVPEYSYGSVGMLANYSEGVASKIRAEQPSTAAGQQNISASVVVDFELM